LSSPTIYLLTVSAPARCLSPNSRAHWRSVSKAKKKLRGQAAVMSRAANAPEPLASASCRATFYVKCRRRRDGDNALASLKAAFDGLQDGGLIADDSGLIHHPVRFVVDKEKAGTVELEITEA